MTIEIVEFDDDRLKAAASLVEARYRTELEREPLLSRRYQHAVETLSFLHDLRSKVSGVVAQDDGRRIGFNLGMVLMFKGVYTAYVPDFGHEIDTLNSRNVYRDMYAQLATRWGGSGCFTHNISIMAHHRQSIDAFHSLGFGMINIDALRSFIPGPGLIHKIEVRRAGRRDLEVVMSLETKLKRHLASSHIFIS